MKKLSLGILTLLASALAADAGSPCISTCSHNLWNYHSVWNWQIPSNVTVMSYSSATMTNYANFVGSSYGVNTNLDYWTPAFFEAGIGAPTHNISWSSTWTLHNVPQPTGICGTGGAVAYFASKGDTDSKVAILDDVTGHVFSIGVANCDTNGNLIVGTGGGGAVNSFSGPGWWSNGGSNPSDPWIDATGASLLGGLITSTEWSAGVIPHALAMAWPNSVVLNSGTFPAVTSDGQCSDNTKCMPAGSLIQADPTLSDTYWTGTVGVASADLPIIHALQTYGAYNMDSTGSSSAVIYFRAALGNSSTLYSGATALPHAVLSHLRIVQGPTQAQTMADENRNSTAVSGVLTSP